MATRLTLRIDFGATFSLGPGKIRLLELVRDTGSISAAGRAMDMSYRRAWLLVDALNTAFREPVVTTKLGGKSGGGAELTRFGEQVIAHYRAMEREAHASLHAHVATLEAAIAPSRGATDAGARRTPLPNPPPQRPQGGDL